MKKKDIAITAYKCKKCGKLHYPYHDRCLECKNREFEKVKPQGDVKLLTYTTIYNLPWGFDQRFLILGIAEFENHIKVMGQIIAESTDGLKIGMKMKPYWDVIRYQYGEPVYGLKFDPTN